MDEFEAAEAGPDTPGAPRQAARSPRSDRTHAPATVVVDAARGQAIAATATPLIASRSLGPLLRLGSLNFKLESCQPTGSWLDRGAVRVVASAKRQILGVVGAGPLSLALAAQCARVGRQLIVLLPTEGADDYGLLEALGARIVRVDADTETLRARAPSMLAQVGGRYVGADDSDIRAGFRELLSELESAGQPDGLLAFGSVTVHEAVWLTEAASERQAAPTFPLDGMKVVDERRVHAVVGTCAERTGPAACVGGVIQQPVSGRDVAAAQRLLAREEGIISSLSGAIGLASLIRAVQDDRRAPLRERRLPRDVSAVVVVTRDQDSIVGPTLAGDALPRPAVSLDEARTGFAKLLASDGSSRSD